MTKTASFAASYQPPVFLAGLLGDIADIEILLVEEERPAEGVRDDIGSRPGHGNGRDPSLQAADAGQLVSNLDPGFLLIGRGQYLLEMLVVSLDERAFVQDGERRGLGAATSVRIARMALRETALGIARMVLAEPALALHSTCSPPSLNAIFFGWLAEANALIPANG